MVTGLIFKSNTSSFQCEICMKSKIHQLPFTGPASRTEDVLGLVHSDIVGPFKVQSLGEAKYFATFVDNKTRHLHGVNEINASCGEGNGLQNHRISLR